MNSIIRNSLIIYTTASLSVCSIYIKESNVLNSIDCLKTYLYDEPHIKEIAPNFPNYLLDAKPYITISGSTASINVENDII